MIRLRSKLLLLSRLCYFQNYQVSTFKKQTKKQLNNIPNPFKGKSFADINRILSNTNVKNQISMVKLALSTIYDQIIRDRKAFCEGKYQQIILKQQIINKSLTKLLCQIDELKPQTLAFIVDFYNQMVGLTKFSKNLRLSDYNHLQFRKLIPQIVKKYADEDRQGKYVKQFSHIMYSIVRSGRRYQIIRIILQYLIKFGFKQKQEFEIFFNTIGQARNANIYGGEVEAIISTYILKKQHTIQNTHQWLKPKLIETMINFCHHNRLEYRFYTKKFLTCLLKQIKSEQLSIPQKINFFSKMMQWTLQFYPNPIKMGNYVDIIKSTFNLAESINQDLKKSNIVPISAMDLIKRAQPMFDFITSKNARIIGKTQKQAKKLFQQIYQNVVKKSLIQNIPNLESRDVSSFLKYRLEINPELQNELIENLFKHLAQNKDKNHHNVIQQIRIPQYITKDIMINNSQVNKQQIVAYIRNIEPKISKLKVFEFLRLSTIIQLLEINSPIFKEHNKKIQSPKQEQIIENIVRTNLNDYSFNRVKSCIEKLIKRSQNQQSKNIQLKVFDRKGQVSMINFQILKSIWYTCKKFTSQTKYQNINPFYQLWIGQHYQLFKSIMQKQQNVGFISNLSNKEMVSYYYEVPGSITYQIILDSVKILYNKFKDDMSEDLKKNIHQVLKNLLQYSSVMLLSSQVYRHSFLVKFLWGHALMFKTYLQQDWRYKTSKQIQLVLQFKKYNTNFLYREQPSLITQLYDSTMQRFGLVEFTAPKYIQKYIDYWKMEKRRKPFQIFHRQLSQTSPPTYQVVCNRIAADLGNIYYFEYMISMKKINQDTPLQEISRILSGSILPAQIYEGRLTKQTKLDQILLLDLIQLNYSLAYFCRRFPLIADNLVECYMNIKDFLLNDKIIDVSNFVNVDLAGLISGQMMIKFNKWIQKHIVEIGNLNDYPSLINLYVKFNIQSDFNQQKALKLIREEMRFNNIFLANTIFVNGYENIVDETKYLIQKCHELRVPNYMIDFHQNQLISLMASFLGICLNQKNENLLQIFSKLYLQPYVQQIINSIFKYTSPQFYILLLSAQSRLNESIPQKQIYRRVLSKIDEQNLNIQDNVMSHISENNAFQLKKYRVSYSSQKSNSINLPIANNNYILVDNAQPGWQKYIKQFLQKFHKIGEVKIVSPEQLLTLFKNS